MQKCLTSVYLGILYHEYLKVNVVSPICLQKINNLQHVSFILILFFSPLLTRSIFFSFLMTLILIKGFLFHISRRSSPINRNTSLRGKNQTIVFIKEMKCDHVTFPYAHVTGVVDREWPFVCFILLAICGGGQWWVVTAQWRCGTSPSLYRPICTFYTCSRR